MALCLQSCAPNNVPLMLFVGMINIGPRILCVRFYNYTSLPLLEVHYGWLLLKYSSRASEMPAISVGLDIKCTLEKVYYITKKDCWSVV